MRLRFVSDVAPGVLTWRLVLSQGPESVGTIENANRYDVHASKRGQNGQRRRVTNRLRRGRPRLRSSRWLRQISIASHRGQARLGQDNARPAVPDRGRRAWRECLYITLSESKRELLSVADRHGWKLEGIEILELVPPELSLDPSQLQTLVHASDLELGETVRSALTEMERVKPDRVVFDSLSEIRLLSQGSLRYRRQVLALKSFFLLNNTTVLLLDDLTAEHDDLNLHSISHGVIRMEQLTPIYGGERRRLRIIKMRGVQIRGGYHDFVIRPGGVIVFPRLVAAEHDESEHGPPALAGNLVDTLLGGGLDRGTSTLLMGPSGIGKSTVASSYCHAALHRGERVLVLLFDETRRIFLARAAGVGMDLEPFVGTGMLFLEQINPAELSPGGYRPEYRLPWKSSMPGWSSSTV